MRMLFHRSEDGEFSRVPYIAEIPDEKFNEVNDQIIELSRQVRASQAARISMKQESEIRKEAANCEICNLCMVCAGNHRRYESWPPGTGQCFSTMMKAGKPIRDEPCSLCEIHDQELRDFNRNNKRSLSRESRLKNRLRALIIQRRALFEEYKIEAEIISE